MGGAFRLHWILVVFCLISLGAVACAQQVASGAGDATRGANAPIPPAAKVEVAEDTLQGHKITDPYRWLENAESPETQQFVRNQMAYTRSLLDPFAGRDRISARVTQLLELGSIGTPAIAGHTYMYTRRDGKQNQPILYVREGVNGKDRVLLDPNTLSSDGTVALDWWHPSHQGKYLAYGTSPSGSEISTLHVMEVATGKLLPDVINQTRAASIAWLPDNSGFYYTRYPQKGAVPAGEEMYNRHVFYHKLGTEPMEDRPVFGQGRDAQEWPNVGLSEDGKWLMVVAEQGWSKTEIFFGKAGGPKEELARITTGKEFQYDGDIFQGNLYILSNEDAPRYRVFKADVNHPERAEWTELIPQSDAVLQATRIIGGRLFCRYEKNALSILKVFSLDGKLLVEVPLPTMGTVTALGGDWDSKEAFFGFNSFTVPPSIYRVALTGAAGAQKQGKPELWAKVQTDIVPDKYEVKQVWYKSKDGTKVPMFIVSRKGLKLDGANPTLLSGYGGFNVSTTPAFEWAHGTIMWLDAGGIFAEANLRGGSEFGEEWHKAGMLANKQNVFDDFIAAAEYLIAERYTSTEHLAIYGRSNGGLLTGAALTQRPDLYRAVVCGVPLLDMLRYQKFQIAKLWIPEYGSADDPKQFDWLYAYSPYHHVKAGTAYPATLFFAADTDTRVDPLHAKKMTALLQAQAANGQSTEHPILLRIDSKAGHGVGKPVSKQIEEWTDIWTFLYWQLGVKPQ